MLRLVTTIAVLAGLLVISGLWQGSKKGPASVVHVNLGGWLFVLGLGLFGFDAVLLIIWAILSI